MSLSDEITGGKIYNPLIRIYSPEGNKHISMNSTTFGEEGQSKLILPEKCLFKNKIGAEQLYKVTAVVVEQSRAGPKRPQRSGQIRSETLIGHITETTLQSIIDANKK